MSKEIQILETPIGETTEADVRAELARQFPDYRVASVDKNENKWQVRLEKQAEFPLKGLGPEDDAKDDAADDSDDDVVPADEEKPKDDAPEDKPKDDAKDDKPPFADKDDKGGDSHEDPIARIEHLLRDLQKVIPQLQHILKGDGPGADEAPHDVAPPHLAPDPGPHFNSPHLPPPRPRLPGGVGGPMGGPAAGRVPGIAGPPRSALPTFTKRRALRLNREANVAESVAREELTNAYPDYTIEEMTLQGDQFVAKLRLK